LQTPKTHYVYPNGDQKTKLRKNLEKRIKEAVTPLPDPYAGVGGLSEDEEDYINDDEEDDDSEDEEDDDSEDEEGDDSEGDDNDKDWQWP
jgi:hypothetical protein